MNRLGALVALFSVLFCPSCGQKDTDVSGKMHENDKETVIHGRADLQHQSFKSLTIQGTADLEDVTVKKDLLVQGKLEAEKCDFHDVTVQGTASVEESKILGTIHVMGNAEFEKSILDEVKVTGQEVELEDCKVKSVFMKKGHVKQIVILENTQVSDDVTFEEEGGLVELKGSSKIHGKVIGGEIKE